jgi:hypothetical protein
MNNGAGGSNDRIAFPGLTAGEAAAVARELELEFIAAGVPAEALGVVRNDAEAMDFGGTLAFIGGMLTWELAKAAAKGAGSEIGKAAGCDAYGFLRRKLDEFCQRRRIAAEVDVPGHGTWFLRTEYDRSGEQAASVAIPHDVGTLGVALLGAGAFPHLDGLDNSAATASALFAAPGTMFRSTCGSRGATTADRKSALQSPCVQ